MGRLARRVRSARPAVGACAESVRFGYLVKYLLQTSSELGHSTAPRKAPRRYPVHVFRVALAASEFWQRERWELVLTQLFLLRIGRQNTKLQQIAWLRNSAA